MSTRASVVRIDSRGSELEAQCVPGSSRAEIVMNGDIVEMLHGEVSKT